MYGRIAHHMNMNKAHFLVINISDLRNKSFISTVFIMYIVLLLAPCSLVYVDLAGWALFIMTL